MKKSEIRLIITAITTLVLAVICGFITIVTFFGSLVEASKDIEFDKWRESVVYDFGNFTSVIDDNEIHSMVEDFNEGVRDLQEAYDITGG